jgi:D-amino-acid oxidase
MRNFHVKILGSGVSGLTTAIVLREAGYRVSLTSQAQSPHTTSDVAAAFWYPFHVGHYSQDWAIASYSRFASLMENNATGIRNEVGKEYFQTVEDFDDWMTTTWWTNIEGINCSPLEKRVLPAGFARGVTYTVPVIHMGLYMDFLAKTILQDCPIHTRPFTNLEDALTDCDAVVNCTGLGSFDLVPDRYLYPCRGQIVVIDPIPISGLLFITRGPDYKDKPLYIVPRYGIDIVLGGTTDDDKDELITDETVANDIVERCARFEPGVKTAKRRGSGRIGLRPCRDGRGNLGLELLGPRVDPDTRFSIPVIHNYGHGGAGVTLSWGCAEEVVRLLDHTLGARQRA